MFYYALSESFVKISCRPTCMSACIHRRVYIRLCEHNCAHLDVILIHYLLHVSALRQQKVGGLIH